MNQYRQMVFLTGPRQVGKTTLCKSISQKDYYFNWDNQDDRVLIISGPNKVAEGSNIHQLTEKQPIIIFDEIHKYGKWKDFLKGFFDSYGDHYKIVVTGSSRLDIYKKTGDSLMGRYFLYHLHPFSVREIIHSKLPDQEIQKPLSIKDRQLQNLIQFGGFPEPYITAQVRFSNRWKKLRQQQFIQEDLRDFTLIQEIHQIELLALLLQNQTGHLVNYSNLSNKVNVTVDTIRRWISTLESLYYCYRIYPWSKNISRSLIKQPKVYLWDWSFVKDRGARLENFVASHLLKAVHWWNDNGFGEYGLYFLRDKDKREIDFLVTKDEKPWFLVEVKSSSKTLNKNLFYFQEITHSPHAFQIAFDLPFVNKDCFHTSQPTIVPLKTFLSQLV